MKRHGDTSGQTSTYFKTRKNKLLSTCGIALVYGLIAVAGPAAAQDAASGATEADVIVVTGVATKTDSNIMEVPQSISVVDSDQFIDRGAVTFQDIFRYSAGVSTESLGEDTRGDFFGARGFETQQYLDGLSRMPDFVYGARMDVFTIERAEILRGPSGVLYGSGAPGGLFNAVSKTPNWDYSSEIGLIVGTNEHREVRLDVTGALSDTVAGRFVGVARQGQLQPEGQDDNRVVIMPSISWAPTQNTDITFLVLYQQDDLGTQTYLPLTKSATAPTNDERLPIDFFIGEPGFNHMDMEHLSGTLMIDHRFNDNISVHNRTRYFDQSVDYAEVYGDLSDGVDPFIDAGRTLLAREFYVLAEDYQVLNSDSHAKFDFATGQFSHQLLLGVDYLEFTQDRREGYSCNGFEGFFGCFAGGSPPPLDITNPQYGADFDFGFTNAYDTKSTQLGYYLQDQINYGERVAFVLGVRRDRATSEVSGIEEDPNSATTVKAGVIVDVGGGVSPYFSYSESFQPVFGGDFFGNAFVPQEARQYEAGFKWQPISDALITFAYFDIKESNFVTADPDFIQNSIQSGEIGSTGFEIEANANLFDGFNVSAAYSYTDAEVLSDNGGREGLPVENVPEHLASIWGVQSLTLNDWDVRIGGGVRYTGEKQDTFSLFETKPVTLVDALLEVERDQWSVALNVTNLFDEEYYAFCVASSNPYGACYPGMSRRAFITLRRRY